MKIIGLLLSALFIMQPAYAQPGRDNDGPDIGKKVITHDDKGPDLDKGKNVKRNAVKKAGTAAAVGVATTKAVSAVKKDDDAQDNDAKSEDARGEEVQVKDTRNED